MTRSLLLKFGGSVAAGAGADPVLRDLAELAASGVAVTVVHGGGPAVDAELRTRGIVTARIAGQRVTDAATLEVVREVLGRRVNAGVIAALEGAGARAARVGGDDGVFIAEPLTTPLGELGFVGRIVDVEPQAVHAVLASGSIPVVSPIGCARDGQRYNINADTAAGALAAALRVEVYVVVTDVDRVRVVRDDPQTEIERMTVAEAESYAARGIFTDGMIPKIDAALAAVLGGVGRAIICGAGPRAFRNALEAGGGTTIAG